MTEYWCPRRAETGSRMYGPDRIARGSKCSYCGSMHPDDFMDIARGNQSGDLGPTDKSYKVYVDRDGHHAKFYFQHLSEDQKREFVDLYNNRPRRDYSAGDLTYNGDDGPGMKIGFPGHFYTSPFFMTHG